MKNIFYLFACITGLLFLTLRGYCQSDFRPGYIITNSDTIRGLINFRSNSLNRIKCEFKKDVNANTEIYSPFEIDSYMLDDNRFYVSKTILLKGVEKRVFLEYLVDGIVDLYYYNEELEEFFFVEKNNEIVQINNDAVVIGDEHETKYIKYTNQYKGILAKLFNDAPGLFIQLSNAKFELNSLVKLTEEYHNMVCDEYACVQYRKSRKYDVFCEVNAGAALSYLGLTSSKNHASDIKPEIGLSFRIKDNRYNSRFSFIAGLKYSSNSFNGEFKNYLFTEKKKFYNIELDYSILSLPITLEYSLSSSKIQPTFSVSINNAFLINPKYALEIRNYIVEESYSGFYTESPLRKHQFGFRLGAGCRYILNENSYLNCGLNYDFRVPSLNLNYILDYINFNSMTFSVGYGYKIK